MGDHEAYNLKDHKEIDFDVDPKIYKELVPEKEMPSFLEIEDLQLTNEA